MAHRSVSLDITGIGWEPAAEYQRIQKLLQLFLRSKLLRTAMSSERHFIKVAAIKVRIPILIATSRMQRNMACILFQCSLITGQIVNLQQQRNHLPGISQDINKRMMDIHSRSVI